MLRGLLRPFSTVEQGLGGVVRLRRGGRRVHCSDDIWREWTVRLLEVEEWGEAPSEGRGAGGTSREAIC